VKDHEIALRLANIEALLVELLERRRVHHTKSVKRSQSIARRLKETAKAQAKQPSERHFAMARELLSRR
jgi:hypothetical protein